MTDRIASRCAQIGESVTVSLSDLVKTMRAEGVSVLDLGGGDPCFDTPEHITTATIQAINAGFTHYPPSRGIPELLRAIAEKLWKDNGIVADPATDIIVTPSSKHALFIAMMTILSPGDEVLIPTPSWGTYQSIAWLAGATPVPVELTADTGFTVTCQQLASHLSERTKALVINTPNNPTGRALTNEETDAITAYAEANDILIITDEVYEKIIHHGRHISLAAQPDGAGRTLTINGFSKAYAMPGWRLGYVTGPSDIMRPMLAIHQQTVACAGSFIQVGGAAALTGPQDRIHEMVTAYRMRTDLLVRGLNALPGISCRPPEGTFYVFADIRDACLGDSVSAAELLLRRAGVVVAPGTAFGPGGEGYVRMSAAAPIDDLREALDRIGNVICNA